MISAAASAWLSASQVMRGNEIDVFVTGFMPGTRAEIWLLSTPLLLRVADTGDGSFVVRVKIPAGTLPEDHHIVAAGTDTEGATAWIPMPLAVGAQMSLPPTSTDLTAWEPDPAAPTAMPIGLFLLILTVAAVSSLITRWSRSGHVQRD